MENLLAGKYKIEKKIGSGSFGQLYSGIEVDTKGKVAIKLENVYTRTPLLPHEAEIYKHLQGGVGIPHLKWFGVDTGLNIMVIDRLGPSLEDLFNFCDRKFTLKTILMLASQMIDRIEFVHERGILHRDLKPNNFLLGAGLEAYQVYIIDFGLGKKYKDSETNTHIPYRENKNLIGTALYASLNTHLGIEQSRRDDLESLGYMLMYFLRGSLPWDSLKCSSKKEIFEKIKEKKMLTTIEELCKSYPPEFSLYFHYCRSLGFTEKPDYEYLKSLFHKLLLQEGYQFDYIYNWITYRGPQSSTEVTQQRNGSTSGHELPPIQKPEGFASSFRSLAQAIRCGGCGPSNNSKVEKCKRDQALVANKGSIGNDCSNNNQHVNNLEHVSSANACKTPNEGVINRVTTHEYPSSKRTKVQEVGTSEQKQCAFMSKSWSGQCRPSTSRP